MPMEAANALVPFTPVSTSVVGGSVNGFVVPVPSVPYWLLPQHLMLLLDTAHVTWLPERTEVARYPDIPEQYGQPNVGQSGCTRYREKFRELGTWVCWHKLVIQGQRRHFPKRVGAPAPKAAIEQNDTRVAVTSGQKADVADHVDRDRRMNLEGVIVTELTPVVPTPTSYAAIGQQDARVIAAQGDETHGSPDGHIHHRR